MGIQSLGNGVDSHDHSSSCSPQPSSGRRRTSTVDSFNSFLSLSQKNQSQRGAIFRRVGGASMFSDRHLGDNSFILEEGEINGSFPQEIIDGNSNHSHIDEETREK